MDRLTLEGFKKRLEVMKRQAAQLCGVALDGSALAPATVKFFENMLKDVDDPEVRKKRDEFVERMKTDPKAKAQFCSLRIEQFQNYAMADQNIINMFYEVANLKDDERPVYQNNTMNEVTITYIAQDGQQVQRDIIKPQEEGLIDMRIITTPEIEYKLTDVYRGNVVDSAMATLNLSYDMANQREALAMTLLGTGIGNFTLTGNKQSRVYLANSRINASNLPTTNSITLTGNSSSTNFRFLVFKAIKKYGEQWGKAFREGPVVPTGRILVPSLDAADIADEIVPTGATANNVADRLMDEGYAQIHYLGRDWTLVTDNTLAPKSCYAEFTRKAGRIYLKPGLDKEKSDEDSYEAAQKNRGKRFMQSPIGLYMPQPTRVNLLKVVYRT